MKGELYGWHALKKDVAREKERHLLRYLGTASRTGFSKELEPDNCQIIILN